MPEAALDPVKTAPFLLGPEAGEPCLVLHGFTGTPWDVRPLGEALAGAGYRVRGIRLPGHALTPEEMRRAGAADWERAAAEALAELGERPVRIAGLSMGCLLAVRLAARFPEKVRGLALLAPALRFQGTLMAVLRAVRPLRLLHAVRPWVTKSASDIEDALALAEAPILPRFPVTSLGDLFELQDLAEASLSAVRAPSLTLFAVREHVVSRAGARALSARLGRHARAEYREFERGFHIMPRDLAGDEVARAVVSFFGEI